MSNILKFPDKHNPKSLGEAVQVIFTPNEKNNMYDFFKSQLDFMDKRADFNEDYVKLSSNKCDMLNAEVNKEPVVENRPYSDNPSDFMGERGNVEITGITLRDLSDMLIRSFVKNGGDSILNTLNDIGKLVYGDVYTIPSNTVDPLELINTLLVDIENKMKNKK